MINMTRLETVQFLRPCLIPLSGRRWLLSIESNQLEIVCLLGVHDADCEAFGARCDGFHSTRNGFANDFSSNCKFSVAGNLTLLLVPARITSL